MTETDFTPGPWVVGIKCDYSIETNGENAFTFIGRDLHKPIAAAIVHSAFGMDWKLDANAHLIAAAPELYEALENLLSNLGAPHVSYEAGHCMCGDDMENHSNPYDCGHNPTDAGEYYMHSAMDEARAALAKARGES